MKMKSISISLSFFLIILLFWELAPQIGLVSPLLLPPFSGVMKAFFQSIIDLTILERSLMSLEVVATGYFIGLFLAFILAALGVISESFWDLVRSLSAILHPIPGVALLPLAILWFGIGTSSIVFVIVHSVLWPMLLSSYSGFKNVPPTYLEVARNLELSKLQIILKVMLPSAFSEIITGAKIGWARAWRALVGGEMVFGATGASGGLGWYIYEKRFFMDTAGVFSGLIMIAILGIFVEYFLFGSLQKHTIERWGMKKINI